VNHFPELMPEENRKHKEKKEEGREKKKKSADAEGVKRKTTYGKMGLRVSFPRKKRKTRRESLLLLY